MDKKKLFERIKQFPKVDLHRHLEGSILPETLLIIAKKYGGILPTYELDQLRHLFQFIDDPPGFHNFLDKFKLLRGFYPNQHAIEEIAYTAVKEAAEDNVKYLELRYSPTHFASKGKFQESDVIKWIQNAIERAARRHDIIVTPILTISRDYGYELASNTVELAIKLSPAFFYGLDIAGDEISNSAKPYLELFEKAKEFGLGLTIHAGEAGDVHNVREAVVDFNADRVGHGVRSAGDVSMMGILREKKILLELCLTSNLCTGVVPSIASHPIRKLMEAGVPVSLNTDDPAILGITLTGEYVAAITELGFNEDDLKFLNLAALEHSFYPDRDKLKEKLYHYWV
jgi:adenosine deaminase